LSGSSTDAEASGLDATRAPGRNPGWLSRRQWLVAKLSNGHRRAFRPAANPPDPASAGVSGASARLVDLAIVFGLALILRMAIVVAVPAGFPTDMAGWVEAALLVTTRGIQGAYGASFAGNLYPPAFFYPLWLAGSAFRGCCDAASAPGGAGLDLALRLGAVAADSLIAALVYLAGLRLAGSQRAREAALVYAINPAVLATVAWMGMVGDSFYLLFVLLALLAVLHGRWALAAPAMVVAALTKPQALTFLPFFAALFLLRAPRGQALAGIGLALLSGLILVSPFLLSGRAGDLAGAAARMASAYPYVHFFANNLWYLAAGGGNPLFSPSLADTNLLVGWVAYRDVGLLAFGLLNLVALRWLTGREDPWALVAALSVVALGFFLLNTRMQVNYSLPAIALLCILWATADRRYRRILLAVTLMCLINWLLLDWRLGALAPTSVRLLHLLNAAAYVLAGVVLFVAARGTVAGTGRQAPRRARDALRLRGLARAGVGLGVALGGGAALAGLAGLSEMVDAGAVRSGLFFGVAILAVSLLLLRADGTLRAQG
jgi:Gpi18-like mannosyltransferase